MYNFTPLNFSRVFSGHSLVMKYSIRKKINMHLYYLKYFFIFLFFVSRWIEVWQRKHRQYICEDSPSIAPHFNHFGYTCKHTRDELRMSFCANKNNNSVVEVLKADIECGWSSGSKMNGLNLVFTICVGVVLRSLL